jgi:hypothetical protein
MILLILLNNSIAKSITVKLNNNNNSIGKKSQTLPHTVVINRPQKIDNTKLIHNLEVDAQV